MNLAFPVALGLAALALPDPALAQLAPACGLACEERSITLAELRRADAVFVTNSLRLIAPVTAIGDSGGGDTGYAGDHPVLMRLMAALRDRVAAECGVSASVVASIAT